MLKRLELVGFKSFADKTQFDFAPGITGLVGPNGSGKSNIVDAVRWILGEQSAKSLRGGEMADVIFNGSTTRRSLGLAEVTMTFDNARGQLNTESAEIQITRRVYRNGEGEYLINHQTSRLKDIKDLFLGSGAGASTYCIIEQGRVDALLQASTKDRRIIFEEAAGISRFKAKKTETLRKLERVEQNLQRLRDIIDEVEKQLRSVKLQAAKAQRYQEYSERLRELRVRLGLAEYHEISEKLQEEEAILTDLRAQLSKQSSQVESAESTTRQLDETLAGLEEKVHAEEGRLGQALQQIASEETTLGREQDLAAELEEDLARRRLQVAELNVRVANLSGEAEEAARDCTDCEKQCEEQLQAVRQLDDALQSLIVRQANLQRQVQADKNEHLELMRQAARWQNDAVTCRTQMENLQKERDRLRQKGANAEESLASLEAELKSLADSEAQLKGQVAETRQELEKHLQERDRVRLESERTTTQVSELREQRSGLASRIEVLDKLEQSQEGLGAGVREVLALLEAKSGTWNRDLVPGIVADFLTVQREYAPLVDLALGDRTQSFLVRDGVHLAEALNQLGQPLTSRVNFIPIHDTTTERPDGLDELAIWAVEVVKTERSDLANLAAQLLGNTWIVPDLAAAFAIHEQAPGLRFVTRQGELLESDGSLTVGVHHAEAGIISRKTELRELRREAENLDQRIVQTEQLAEELRQRSGALDEQTESFQQTIAGFNEQLADVRSRLGQQQERRTSLHEEVQLSRSEMSGIDQEITALEEAYQRAHQQTLDIDQKVQEVQARLEETDREIQAKEEERQQQQQANTQAKVAMGQMEERLRAFRSQWQQLDADLQQRQQEQSAAAAQLTAAIQRRQDSQRIMLTASSALGWWYLEKEAGQRQVAQFTEEREQHRRQRQALAEKLQQVQIGWREQQELAHVRELTVSELRHRRDTLADRLREDYQIDLAELYRQHLENPLAEEEADPVTEPGDPTQEIEELKRKLSRLGSVNMEALQELNELEDRSQTLNTQSSDLTTAQRSLQEIIGKINVDSRKLFTDAFTTIRGHFQELFRKLFGGGMADVVLEDDVDILESGIEIVARPPGKELRSISLMSGGEKTMTAVALLLAIFRSKPSPFCILDEVDAALDEANIDRFTAVLREFLDMSHFIIVTHSKKTMATADVLYGITMQESGISKRVAVRLEDWPDDEPQEESPAEPQAEGKSKAG